MARPSSVLRPPSVVGLGSVGYTVFAVGFDFAQKIERRLDESELQSALDAGMYVWVDLEVRDVEEARRFLGALGLAADCADRCLEVVLLG